jgi:hypothetical protein
MQVAGMKVWTKLVMNWDGVIDEDASESFEYEGPVTQCLGGGGDAPDPPDPEETAQAQAQANIQTAIAQALMNNANQQTPFGSINYTQTGSTRVGEHDVPTWNINQTLSPSQQELFDSRTDLTQGGIYLADHMLRQAIPNLSSQFTLEGLPGLPTNMDQFRGEMADSLMQRFDQDYGRQEAGVRNRMANSGIQEGSEAWNAEMDRLSRARTDAVNQAYQSAGTEAQRMYGMQKDLRQQGTNERMLMRAQPINEITGMLGLGSGVQLPQFQSGMGTNVAPTDVIGPTMNQYNGQMAQWQQGQQNQNSMMGGLFGLGAAAMPLVFGSDIRIKEDIRRVGKTDNGLPVYLFRYKGHPGMQIGLMAQDVELVVPEAVVEINGIKHVDYAKAVEA